MKWEQAIRAAASASRASAEHLQPLLRLLREAEAGTARTLLDSLRTLTVGCVVSSDRVRGDLDALVAAVLSDDAREAEARARAHVDRPACQRCGSLRTETRSTGAVRPALTEILCVACGNIE